MLDRVQDSTAAIGLRPGTPVLTPRGPVAAEALAPGALVLAVSGVAAPFRELVAVDRISLAAALVRIRAGALADGAPAEDLVVPRGLALLIDGALVAAGDLVDGLGVLEEAAQAAVTLVRLTFETHDAVLAAGTAVETALPDAGAAPCAPRRTPDATLHALLAWRAEAMGWATPTPPAEAPPAVGTLRARLAASPMARIALPLTIKPPR
jgi:hypothetical protein